MPDTLKADRDAVLAEARQIVDGARTAGRDLSADETKQLNGHVAKIQGLNERIELAANGANALKAFGSLPPADNGGTLKTFGNDAEPKSWGHHFVKHCGAKLREMKGVSGASVTAPEFKASGDYQAVPGVFSDVLTTIDRTIIPAVRPRLVIADLLGSGTISGQSISYFIEGAFEGAFAPVAEGGSKPQVHVADPTIVTDALRKLAGFIKFTDEMLEDLDFVVSEINGRLPYQLSKVEEAQLLDGAGTGQNLLGLLRRSGIQTEARGTTASGDTVADTIFRAITKCSVVAGLDADGIVIHPTDYQALRLARDVNGQYYGGGFFSGQYNVGGIMDYPNIWGLRTVVSPSTSVGTALVGAFKQVGTVYRKGGVRIESTNSHAEDFTNNLVTTRVEERIGLAVRRPAGLVKVTLTAAP